MRKLNISRQLKSILLATCLSFSLAGCKNNDQNDLEIIKEETEETFSNFSLEREKISKCIVAKNFKDAKEYGKKIFVTGIDFIFYDQEINGVTFQGLSDKARKETLNNLHLIDSNLECFVPGYKSLLEEKYQIVNEFVDEKYLMVIDTIKDYLGDENYQAIGAVKNKISTDFKEQKNKGLSKIKTWYENFRK